MADNRGEVVWSGGGESYHAPAPLRYPHQAVVAHFTDRRNHTTAASLLRE